MSLAEQFSVSGQKDVAAVALVGDQVADVLPLALVAESEQSSVGPDLLRIRIYFVVIQRKEVWSSWHIVSPWPCVGVFMQNSFHSQSGNQAHDAIVLHFEIRGGRVKQCNLTPPGEIDDLPEIRAALSVMGCVIKQVGVKGHREHVRYSVSLPRTTLHTADFAGLGRAPAAPTLAWIFSSFSAIFAGNRNSTRKIASSERTATYLASSFEKA